VAVVLRQRRVTHHGSCCHHLRLAFCSKAFARKETESERVARHVLLRTSSQSKMGYLVISTVDLYLRRNGAERCLLCSTPNFAAWCWRQQLLQWSSIHWAWTIDDYSRNKAACCCAPLGKWCICITPWASQGYTCLGKMSLFGLITWTVLGVATELLGLLFGLYLRCLFAVVLSQRWWLPFGGRTSDHYYYYYYYYRDEPEIWCFGACILSHLFGLWLWCIAPFLPSTLCWACFCKVCRTELTLST